ncbi:MAG: hypothetical protein D4R93_03185 [Deltaproteobacteria bacterium]|nr:MAG: hypothetical protein D4R93_03185 [Deltaproteobacteria bacterium]
MPEKIKFGGFNMNRKMVGFLFVALLSLSMIACSEKKEAAAPSAVPLQVFKQEITSPATLPTVQVDAEAAMDVVVKNTGNEPWRNKGIDEKGTNLVALGFHWIDKAGNAIQEGRALLPNDLMPGASVSLNVTVLAPLEPGNYKLRFSMVQEHVAWFNNKGAEPFFVNVTVKK